MKPRSETRRELTRQRWEARQRARKAITPLERSQAWLAYYQARIAARAIPRTLEGV